MTATVIYEVKSDTPRGGLASLSLWWTRSAAESAAFQAARDTAGRDRKRKLERDEFDPIRWNVLSHNGLLIMSFYVLPRDVNGTAIDRLAALA